MPGRLRTDIASHNPRVYKERVVGAWYVNGTSPLDVWSKKR